jgi:hypothetical protein
MPKFTYSWDLIFSLKQFGEHLHHQKIRSLALPQMNIEDLQHDLREFKEVTNLDEVFILTQSYGHGATMPGVMALLPRRTRSDEGDHDFDLWSLRVLEQVKEEFRIGMCRD